jgi:hypothetical protein
MCLHRTFHLHDQDMLRGVLELVDDRDPVVAAFLSRDASAMAAHWEREAHRAISRGDAAAAWQACYRTVHQTWQPNVQDEDVVDAYARAAALGGFTCWAKLAAARSARARGRRRLPE